MKHMLNDGNLKLEKFEDNSEFKKYLESIEGCQPAIEWVGPKGLSQSWGECHRGDWMLRLAERLQLDFCVWEKKDFVLVAIEIAKSILHLAPNEDRAKKAIGAAEAWVKEPTEKNRIAASRAYASCLTLLASSAKITATSASVIFATANAADASSAIFSATSVSNAYEVASAATSAATSSLYSSVFSDPLASCPSVIAIVADDLGIETGFASDAACTDAVDAANSDVKAKRKEIADIVRKYLKLK